MIEEYTHWLEIDRLALLGNLGFLRSCLDPKVEMACVVKANAYGHGLEQVIRILDGHCEWLAVHSVEEAKQIRDLGVETPRLLVMGSFLPSQLQGLDAGVHLFVSRIEDLEILERQTEHDGFQLGLHLKVDTGTNRQGFRRAEVLPVVVEAARRRLRIDGLATHFANIEDTLEPDFARRQLAMLQEIEGEIVSAGHVRPRWMHSACSAAVLLVSEAAFDLARPGISLYGFWPSRETRLAWVLANGRESGDPLTPVLSWKARVGQLKRVPKGETVGYGRSWTAGRDSTIGVLPVGYGDGLPRALGNRGRVLVHGVSVPIVGRVCMNITMIDVTDLEEVAVGDPCVLLGSQGDAQITAEEIAGLCGTIQYEIVARLSALTPRVVTNDVTISPEEICK